MRRWFRRRRDELRCQEVANVLQSHIDGELDQATAEKVSTHLDACLRCGMAASTYRELKSKLARLSDPVDVDAVERLRAFVDELTEHEAD
jgi:anti-sigma factor RsiW